MKDMSEEVEKRIIDEIAGPEEGTVSRKKLIELLDIYHFLPIRIKRDRNDSKNLYYVLNSNKRGQPQDRQMILDDLKSMNDKMHLTKLMTLISIKIDEKFTALAKAFLFFDMDADQLITRTEFSKGIEGLRVKFSKADVDLVFDHLDSDGDKCLNYKEFCGLSEERRRNIDPFEAADNIERMNRSNALSHANGAKMLNLNPYSENGMNSSPSTNSRLQSHHGNRSYSSSALNSMRFEDLESQASALKIMNHSSNRHHRRRKASVPYHILNNKSHVFGSKSDVILPDKNAYATIDLGMNSQANSTGYGDRSAGSSSMQHLLAHSDNMKAGIQNKINMKL